MQTMDIDYLKAELDERDPDLQLQIHTPHHYQIRFEGKVLVDWWPGKGTTMVGGKKGPICRTEDQLLSWLFEIM